jgi:hypothetical protein
MAQESAFILLSSTRQTRAKPLIASWVFSKAPEIDGSREHVRFAVINATNARETPHVLKNIFKDLRNFPHP